MSFLLDTNVLSEYRKGKRADRGVQSWFEGVPSTELYLSAIVLGEVRQGIERVRRRDPRSAVHLERWLSRLQDTFSDRILPIDAAVADAWGRLNAVDPLPAVDGLLAATALVHELTIVTRNTEDFSRAHVSLLNPFAQ